MEYFPRKLMWYNFNVASFFASKLNVFHGPVVIWSDMLGGVLIGEEPLPWSGPLFSHQISGERRETGQTSECCLFQRNVRYFNYLIVDEVFFLL